jgi:hypothetical protein
MTRSFSKSQIACLSATAVSHQIYRSIYKFKLGLLVILSEQKRVIVICASRFLNSKVQQTKIVSRHAARRNFPDDAERKTLCVCQQFRKMCTPLDDPSKYPNLPAPFVWRVETLDDLVREVRFIYIVFIMSREMRNCMLESMIKCTKHLKVK